MNPLQQIPTRVRVALYWVGYVVGVVGQCITIVWGAVAATSPDVKMPLGLVIASAIIGLLQTQLNLLAGSNVAPETNTAIIETPADVSLTSTYEGEHRPEGGRVSILAALAGALLVAAVVALILGAHPVLVFLLFVAALLAGWFAWYQRAHAAATYQDPSRPRTILDRDWH